MGGTCLRCPTLIRFWRRALWTPIGGISSSYYAVPVHDQIICASWSNYTPSVTVHALKPNVNHKLQIFHRHRREQKFNWKQSKENSWTSAADTPTPDSETDCEFSRWELKSHFSQVSGALWKLQLGRLALAYSGQNLHFRHTLQATRQFTLHYDANNLLSIRQNKLRSISDRFRFPYSIKYRRLCSLKPSVIEPISS